MDSLTFFRNWYDLAKLQTDDSLRLAFYDAVFAYAFDGEVPPDPGRGGKKTERAARFAYLTVAPVINISIRKRGAGLASGIARKKRGEQTREQGGEQTREQGDEQTREQNGEQTREQKTQPFRKEKKRIEENRIEGKVVVEGADAPAATASTVSSKDVENFFKRLKNNTTVRVTDEERDAFTEWLTVMEFQTSNGPVTKRGLPATFMAWRRIRAKELVQRAEIVAARVNIEPGSSGFTKITEADL